MKSHCRLFDENIVRSIMVSTGISLLEFINENDIIDIEDICEFVEYNADAIIDETIKNMKDEDNHDNPPDLF